MPDDPYRHFADQHLGDLPPELRDTWLKQYAPAPPEIGPPRPPPPPMIGPPAPPPNAHAAPTGFAAPKPHGAPLDDALSQVWKAQPAAEHDQPPQAPVNEPPQAPIGPPRPPPKVGKDEMGAPYAAPSGGGTSAGAGGGGGGGGVAPGTMRKESEQETVQDGIKFSDNTINQRDAAMGNAALANKEHLEANIMRSQVEGQAAANQAETERAFAAAERENYSRYQNDLQRETRRLQDDIAGVRDARIDPNKFWQDRGTGSQILAALGMALGAAAATRMGGPNHAADIVNRAIDRDIDAQARNLQAKQQTVGMQQSYLGQLTQQYGHEAQARLALKAMGLEAARSELAASLQPVRDKEVLARGYETDAALQRDQAKVLAEYDIHSANKVTRTSVAALQVGGVRGGGGGGGAGSGGLTKKEETDTKDLSIELQKAGIPENRAALNRVLALIPESGDIPGIGGAHRIAQTIGGRAEKADNVLYSFFGSETGKAIKQAAATLFNKKLKDDSGAAVSDQEMDRAKDEFYGAKDAASARRALHAYESRLNQVEANIRAGHNAAVNSAQRERRTQWDHQLGAENGPKEVTPVKPIGAK